MKIPTDYKRKLLPHKQSHQAICPMGLWECQHSPSVLSDLLHKQPIKHEVTLRQWIAWKNLTIYIYSEYDMWFIFQNNVFYNCKFNENIYLYKGIKMRLSIVIDIKLSWLC